MKTAVSQNTEHTRYKHEDFVLRVTLNEQNPKVRMRMGDSESTIAVDSAAILRGPEDQLRDLLDDLRYHHECITNRLGIEYKVRRETVEDIHASPWCKKINRILRYGLFTKYENVLQFQRDGYHEGIEAYHRATEAATMIQSKIHTLQLPIDPESGNLDPKLTALKSRCITRAKKIIECYKEASFNAKRLSRVLEIYKKRTIRSEQAAPETPVPDLSAEAKAEVEASEQDGIPTVE